MRTFLSSKIRALLRSADEGLTVLQLSSALKADAESVRKRLRNMPDTYIDRWQRPKRGQYAAVWCVVVPPPDCPRPEKPKGA